MELLGFEVDTHPEVYEPAEDTLLLARHVEEVVSPGVRCLELGCGTGLVSLVLAAQGAGVVAVDVNPLACALTRGNARANDLAVDVVQGDLATAIDGTFDLVVCNPPYLPTEAEDRVLGPLNRAFDGGPDGNRTTRRVIEDLDRLLAPGGRALLLVSTLQDLDALEALAWQHGWTWRELAREPHGFETLVCSMLQQEHS